MPLAFPPSLSHWQSLPRLVSHILPQCYSHITNYFLVTLVVNYVGSQLHNSRNIMDSRFAQYNNSQSEAQRARTFEGRTSLDPRRSMFNILGH